MQLRLNAIPSGLKDLFDHMFSNIDDVHRADLSLYFHLLLWDLPISVALVTRLLRKHPYESLQEYQEDGQSMCSRILTQSKGLLYITYEARAPGGWSLKDIATDRFRLQYFDGGKVNHVHDHTSSYLRWIHRSAYDYISSLAFENTGFWLTPMDNADLICDTFRAYRWLAQYTPMIHIKHRYGLNNRAMNKVVSGIVELVHKMSDQSLVGEAYHVLDEIYSALYRSMIEDSTSRHSRPILTATYRERISVTTAQWHNDLVMLRGFWSAAYLLEEYLLSRFDAITTRAHGVVLCIEILYDQQYDNIREPNATVQRSTFKALEHISKMCAERDVEPRALFGESTVRIMSWAGSELDCAILQRLCLCLPYLDSDVLLPAILAKAACGHVHERDDVEVESRLAVVCDSYQLFIDCGRLSGPSTWRDLRLLLSCNHFSLGTGVVFPQSFQFPRAVLRLCCSNCPPGYHVGESEVLPAAIYFDLSSQLTTKVMAACCNFDGFRYDGKDPKFSGTSDDLATLQEMIIYEIWANHNGQLDAWGQLYILANVKKWFGSYWKFREPTSSDDSDEWSSESENASESGIETLSSTAAS